ncbi:hypothetical protein F4819DRAFT_487972 [Hypoxylon fuscum]|nr:hypothetical protein F4819DRAFT_487972 [Hypoxylon fuscum]
MASNANPVTGLKNAIAEAIRSCYGPCDGLEVTTQTEEAGDIPYELFWAKVDPRQVIPRDTKEWEEAQWRMLVPVIYVDFSKVDKLRYEPQGHAEDQSQIIYGRQDPRSVENVVGNVIKAYVRIFDNGNDIYPIGRGVNPRLYLVIFKPFNIAIGPKQVHAIVSPSSLDAFNSKLGRGDQKTVMLKREIHLEDGNDLSRVKWESDWIDWRAGKFGGMVNKLKRLLRRGG